MKRLFTLTLALGLAPGCGKQGPVVRVDGSSTVYPITQAVAEEVRDSRYAGLVAVGVSGTGGGFRKLCAGEIDMADASRPIKAIEARRCAVRGIEYVEIPIAFDGIAIVVNPGNNWANQITTGELRRIWAREAEGKVTRWNQLRPEWPDKPLALYGPGIDSGTHDYFNEAIIQKKRASRADYTASEDDNVLVEDIAQEEGALGYFGLAYYRANKDKLKILGVDDGRAENGDGPIAPSSETIRNGTYQPLARPLFLYVNRRALERAEVSAFVKFYLQRASKLVEAVGYVALPDVAYRWAERRVDARSPGSILGSGGGSQVGMSIEGLLEKEK